VIREDNAGLHHPQQAHLMFGLTERAAGIYSDIGVEAPVDGGDGRKCSTDLQRETRKNQFFFGRSLRLPCPECKLSIVPPSMLSMTRA
jgi:hypothetical protein